MRRTVRIVSVMAVLTLAAGLAAAPARAQESCEGFNWNRTCHFSDLIGGGTGLHVDCEAGLAMSGSMPDAQSNLVNIPTVEGGVFGGSIGDVIEVHQVDGPVRLVSFDPANFPDVELGCDVVAVEKARVGAFGYCTQTSDCPGTGTCVTPPGVCVYFCSVDAECPGASTCQYIPGLGKHCRLPILATGLADISFSLRTLGPNALHEQLASHGTVSLTATGEPMMMHVSAREVIDAGGHHTRNKVLIDLR